MIIDMINCPVKFFHEKIIYQDTIYNGNGKIRCWFRKTTEEVGKDENKKKEDFFEVRLTEEKLAFLFILI